MESYATSRPIERSTKYLTFFLKDQPYGVNVENILQIIAIPEITPIPQTPPYIKGVINRSGKITPVMDLRLRLGLPERDYDDRTSIIIVKVNVNGTQVFMGWIVDNVLEVIDIDAEHVDELPSVGTSIDNRYIEGMAKIKGKVITLLNPERVLSKEELIKMKNLQQEKSHTAK